MTTTTNRPMTLEEFLNYDDGTETRYELVVEVVSPGSTNEERDYRYKRSEYAARGIAEYWIVDPQQARVTVLTLVAGFYEEAVFSGSDRLISSTFPNLQLTPLQILQADTKE